MLKALMKVRMASLANAYFGKSKNNKPATPGRKILVGLILIYAVVMLAVMFFGMFNAISAPFYSMGLSWLYFAMFALMDFALMFVGSVFTAKTQLFEAKDNDLLLSMPILPRYILLSRLFVLWLINSFFNIAVALPAAAAWIINCGISVMGAVAFIVIAALLPLFSLAVASLFGWLLSLASGRIRNKTMFTTVFSLIFLGAYMYVINQMNTFIEQVAANGELLAQKLGPIFILSWIGKAIANGDILYFLLSAAVLLLPFAAVYAVLNKTFIKTVTTKRSAKKKAYKESRQRAVKPASALLRRETARFFSSSAYILNAGFGAVMTVVLGVAMIFYMPKLLVQLELMGLPAEYNGALAAVALSFLAGMTNISASSVSMEGKNIWISHSIPVSAGQILASKLKFHTLASGIPTLIASVCIVFALKADFADAAVCLVMPQIFAFFNGVLGLAMNIKFPVLEWENEAQAVKTGTALLVTMFGGMLSAMAAGGGIYLLARISSPAVGCVAVSALFAAVSLALFSWIMKKGAAIYDTL